ncbi:MAG: hypothetical protein NT085_00245 [candidate division SR1 bacterium]|nr:hypothetical protein [candidate division SR1 bacterium]
MNRNEFKIVGIFIVIMLIPWIILFSILGTGDVGKLWKVMTGGFEWIFIIVVLLIVSFVLHKKYQQVFTLLEYIGGSIALVISALATIMLLFYSTTNLADDDRINSHIAYVKWEEHHESSYEECTSEDKDGNCEHYETRCSYVPDVYMACDSVGNVFSITREQFFAIGKYFGTPMEKNFHDYANDHCDDGYWYYYRWGGTKKTIVPSAKKHHYVNYIKASHSVLKYYGQMKGYEKDLAKYPDVYEGPFGPFYLNRVIDQEKIVPQYWTTAVNNELCYHNSYLGPKQEVNIIVYFTKHDRNFTYALHEAWCGGKKNDVVVLIGMDHFPNIAWVEVMSWTPNAAFKIKLRDKIQALKTITDQNTFVKAVVDQIRAPGEDGFERLHMTSMEYLIADIVLPWWAYILSALITALVYAPLMWWFFRNDITDEYSERSSSRNRWTSYSRFKNNY